MKGEPSATPPTRGLSRRERIGLFIHRGLDRRLSPLGVWVFRRTKGGVAKPWKVNALLLTTRGRRSGRERTVVLQYFPDGAPVGDPAVGAMVVAAANDGGERHPAWYLNLIADQSARVEIGGRTVEVRAEELAADEARAWWQRIMLSSPDYERYARATTRTIPIVRLVPVDRGAPQP